MYIYIQEGLKTCASPAHMLETRLESGVIWFLVWFQLYAVNEIHVHVLI